jgi:hypothetical protein
LGKLKLKTQLLKPLSRPYLLQWAEVAEVVAEALEAQVEAVEARLEVAEVVAEVR